MDQSPPKASNTNIKQSSNMSNFASPSSKRSSQSGWSTIAEGARTILQLNITGATKTKFLILQYIADDQRAIVIIL